MIKIYTLFLIIGISIEIHAQDCFNTFNYYRAIDLSLESDQQMIDAHTIAIPINSKVLFDEGKISEDGSDLRVTDSDCNDLSFFIQGIGERENNVLYVAIPSIPLDGISIQLYYGSETDTVSKIDGASVFMFFDDFEDGIIDTSNWEVVGQFSEYAEIDGVLRFTGVFGNGGIFQYVTPKMGFTEPVAFEFAANASNSQVYGVADISDRQRIGLRYDNGNQSFDTMDIIAFMIDTFNGGTNNGIMYPNVRVPRNTLNMVSMAGFINSDKLLNFTRFENYSFKDFNADTLIVPFYEFDAIRPFFSSFGSPIRVEFVGVRKAIKDIPVINIGVENFIGTSAIAKIALDYGVQLFPNPAKHFLNIKIKDLYPKYIKLFDYSGRMLLSTAYSPSIDLSTFESGIYFLLLEFENGLESIDRISIIR